MSFFTDWRSHYTVGFAYGLALRPWPEAYRCQRIRALDRWGYEREQRQHPNNETLTPHQLQEAAAWGAGARRSAGIMMVYLEPYPDGYEWG